TQVALSCELTRGAFSDERVFKLKHTRGEYQGIASRRYCWGEDNRLLAEHEPAEGEMIEGKVAARIIEVLNGNVLVSLPDGEVITVSRDQLLERPTEVGTNVPLRS